MICFGYEWSTMFRLHNCVCLSTITNTLIATNFPPFVIWNILIPPSEVKYANLPQLWIALVCGELQTTKLITNLICISHKCVNKNKAEYDSVTLITRAWHFSITLNDRSVTYTKRFIYLMAEAMHYVTTRVQRMWFI